MCKTCIFGETPLELSPERMEEIKTYLASFTNSHICHTTNKTCYGSLQFQARLLHEIKIIPEPTVDSLLQSAAALFATHPDPGSPTSPSAERQDKKKPRQFLLPTRGAKKKK